jgi:hypothetical protein
MAGAICVRHAASSDPSGAASMPPMIFVYVLHASSST